MPRIHLEHPKTVKTMTTIETAPQPQVSAVSGCPQLPGYISENCPPKLHSDHPISTHLTTTIQLASVPYSYAFFHIVNSNPFLDSCLLFH